MEAVFACLRTRGILVAGFSLMFISISHAEEPVLLFMVTRLCGRASGRFDQSQLAVTKFRQTETV
jgi:hypothetical protein